MGTDGRMQGENHGGDGGPSYNRDRSCSARRRRRRRRRPRAPRQRAAEGREMSARGGGGSYARSRPTGRRSADDGTRWVRTQR